MNAPEDIPVETPEQQGWTWTDEDGIEHWVPDCIEHDADEHDDDAAGGDA